MSISVSGLSKKYGTQLAVNHISFTIGKNEIVGFLGPNGAGKSTTMKMITGYLQSDVGNIEICGMQVLFGQTSTQQKIGYLPEANPLYTDLYVREYLHFIAGIHQIRYATQQVESIIQKVGLTPEAHKKIGQLSKGYKQRVGLAAAMIHDPEVLILDEPTTGLDPNQILEIREVIRQLGQHKTILFSSHIMQEVEALCDRVIIINNGTIVADDKLINLKQKGKDKHQIQVQFKENISAATLQEIQSCSSVKSLPDNLFIIDTEQPDNLKKALLTLSIQKGLNIISMNSESNDLENIFKQLTS